MKSSLIGKNSCAYAPSSFRCFFFVAFFALLLGGFAGAAPANANTDVVTSSADNDAYGTLRYWTENAASGDTITFAPGITHIVLAQGYALEIANSLNIVGPGSSQLAIDGNSNSGVFLIEVLGSNSKPFLVTVSGLTIENGGSAAGMDNDGAALTVNNCQFINSSPGVMNEADNPYEGLGTTLGSITMTNCTISGNSGSAFSGGGIDNAGYAATLTDCTITGNSGQGFFNENGTATLTGCTISNNTGN